MNINIKIKNIEPVEPLNEYVNKRLVVLEKFIKNPDTIIYVEVGKTTNHHKNGDVFKAEIMIGSGDSKFFAICETDDVYKAVDEAKEELVRKFTSNKDKKQTLFKRGASSVKKMLKGISDRNPFTSKY
ncbi:MAG: ribosome-associated translation inhibitor RaiA [Candidatus Nomurabacteria bacterium]|nr:ribosome-associated translation inhibitor RaiA [Candidatus Nomurabacteria bacterium]